MGFGQLCVVVVIMLCGIVDARGALIFSAPPRESVEQGEKLYAPLAEHLSELLGEEVIYKHPKNWLHYQRDIRRDEFDIVFDGPHFVSWRILNMGHTAVAKLPGNLDFYFITLKASNIHKPQDLVMKKVCAIPPPNLTSLVLLNVLNSPIREPFIHGVKGGMKAVIKALINGECAGAVVRKSFYDKKLDPIKAKLFRIIYTSHEIPNQAITVSDKLNNIDIKKIAVSLTEGEGVKFTKNIIKRFSGDNVSAFEKVNENDFIGQNELLEGVVLGW